jgi:hypothetical protein
MPLFFGGSLVMDVLKERYQYRSIQYLYLFIGLGYLFQAIGGYLFYHDFILKGGGKQKAGEGNPPDNTKEQVV